MWKPCLRLAKERFPDDHAEATRAAKRIYARAKCLRKADGLGGGPSQEPPALPAKRRRISGKTALPAAALAGTALMPRRARAETVSADSQRQVDEDYFARLVLRAIGNVPLHARLGTRKADVVNLHKTGRGRGGRGLGRGFRQMIGRRRTISKHKAATSWITHGNSGRPRGRPRKSVPASGGPALLTAQPPNEPLHIKEIDSEVDTALQGHWSYVLHGHRRNFVITERADDGIIGVMYLVEARDNGSLVGGTLTSTDASWSIVQLKDLDGGTLVEEMRLRLDSKTVRLGFRPSKSDAWDGEELARRVGHQGPLCRKSCTFAGTWETSEGCRSCFRGQMEGAQMFRYVCDRRCIVVMTGIWYHGEIVSNDTELAWDNGSVWRRQPDNSYGSDRIAQCMPADRQATVCEDFPDRQEGDKNACDKPAQPTSSLAASKSNSDLDQPGSKSDSELDQI